MQNKSLKRRRNNSAIFKSVSISIFVLLIVYCKTKIISLLNYILHFLKPQKLGLALLLFVVIKFSFAQQPAYFKLGENEFSGVQIYDVIQDNKLNYWFATDQGFYKYDNYKFQLIECNEMNGFSAFGFVKDGNGIIYCYNLNNQIIKIENSKCSILYEMKGDERSNNISLAITNDNKLIILSKTSYIFKNNKQVLKFKTSHSSYFGISFTTKSGAIVSHVSTKDSLLIYENEKIRLQHCKVSEGHLDGVLYFFRIDGDAYAVSSSDKKIYSFDETTLQLTLLPKKNWINEKEFLRYYSANNELWIAGTISGVKRFKAPNKHQLSNKLYENHFISDVFEDSEGNILLSTFNNGVLVIPNLEIPDVHPNSEEKAIISIHNDKDIGIVMGTLKGELLNFKDNNYTSLSKDGTKPLQALFSWNNYPYVLFDDRLIKAYNKNTKKTIPLFEASLKDAVRIGDSVIYLALNVGVCKLQIEKDGKFKTTNIDALKTRANSIEAEPKTQNIYVATSDGLKILNSDKQIESVDLKGEQLFANDLSSDKNTLYASTKKNGILFFENGKITKQVKPQINGVNIEIYKLIVNDAKFYANSSQGFVIIDLNGNVVSRLNMAHGFSTNKIFDFEIIENNLWISHSKGVQKIKLSLLEKKVEKPLLFISNIEVNDDTINTTKQEIVFDDTQRKFVFNISSPTLKNKENIKYHHQLIGYDKDWITSIFPDNKITYNALAPGTYSFVVKAENQGVFSNTATFSFRIKYPFYMRWWFITLSVILFLCLVYLIYRRQLNIQRKKSEQINELNASKLTAIQSQMNPHFIFNSLNSVQDLILKGDVEHSYTYITTFSNLVRRTLNYSEKDFIDFEQEIKLLELYLSLEKLRFKKDFNYEIIYKDIDDIMLPPLLVQPFIENALVHGLLHKEGSKNLKITFELKELLICIVEDNGVGREKAKAIKLRQRSEHESFSGRAIKKRFEILSNVFGGAFGYEYEDLTENGEGTGTKVTLMIPIKHKF